MVTLTPTKVLADTVAAFRTSLPALAAMGGNFGLDPLYLNQIAIGHIESLPTAANYDASTGYANGATEAATLLTDIPITIDKHRHVPVKMAHLQNIANEKKAYNRFIGNQAYVLGKEIVDSVLAKVNAANISYERAEASASVDYDSLVEIGGAMNINQAALTGRRGLVSTAVMNALLQDSRIISGDYHGQLQGGTALRRLVNIAGFETIDEYPDMPGNSAASGTFTAATTDICTKTAHGLLTGNKVRVSSTTTLPAGLAAATTYYVIKIDADTFKLATSAANAAAGTAIDITDTGTGVHSIVGYENLTGFFFESRAFVLKVGVPKQTADLAKLLGIPESTRMETVQDPESGLGLAAFYWQQPGMVDLYTTIAALWGSCVGRQAGAAGALTDRAGYRLASA